jgi:Predicted nucleic acid-binding protein, contains PIN domain
MTLVDTSSWIQFLRRNGDTTVKKRVSDLLHEGSASLCPVVLAELWMGARSGKDRSDLQELQDVLPCLEMDLRVWEICYRLASICCRKGTPVPTSDLLIAACAFSHDTAIESSDKHFVILTEYRVLSRS